MPSEIGRLYDNVYKFPGEGVGLPLQAQEVAWASRTLTLGQVIGRVVVLAVLAGFVAVLVSAVTR